MRLSHQRDAFKHLTRFFVLLWLSANAWAQTLENPLNLAWDNGQTSGGTVAAAAPSTAPGNYYFRINTRAAKVWRTRLTVTTGEANLYMAKGQLPVPGALGTRSSALVGSDGIILSDKNFAVGQDWYVLVQATDPSNTWSLVSGDPYVSDLGLLPYTDSNSDGAYTIGEASQNGGITNQVMNPEGVAFFKITLPPNVPAWALWMNGGSQLVGVRKNLIPVLFETSQVTDRKGNGNLLLVPPYLGQSSDSYFVSVVGTPGSTFSMDSRIQQIEDIAFDGTVPNVSVTGSPYRVFRVEVPADQVVWDMSLNRLSGDPNICVRKQTVPAETDNDALSEAVGDVNDSITLVSPELTNGTWFITLFGKEPYSADLISGTPVITDIGFRSSVTNDQPDRSGWRYYRVPDIASQLGTLGWQLELEGAPIGTEIAIRRSLVPGTWKKKINGATNPTSVRYVNFSSSNSILQRVDHEADIWYVGVYQPNVALGNYTLTLKDPFAQTAGFDAYEDTVENQIEGEWRYFRVNVPEDPELLGWYLDLSEVTGTTTAKITVRRDRLPPAPTGSPIVNSSSSLWLSGAGWAQTSDFTGVMKNFDGTDETGRRFLAATGGDRPLQAGTYYVGVLAGTPTPPAGEPKTVSYKLRSRGIGSGYAISVTPINHISGSATATDLAPRDFRFYSLTVPQNADLPSLTLKLTPSAGDMLIQVRRDSIPDFFPTALVGDINGVGKVGGGKQLSRPDSETLTLLPENGEQHITPGTYYTAVVSQGDSPSTVNLGEINTTGTFTSSAPAPVTDLGILSSTPVTSSFDLPGGDMAFYQVTVPPGTLLVEAYITDRTGSPGISMVPGNAIPKPYPGTTSSNNGYGWVGGQTVGSHPVLVSIHEPTAGVHTIAVRANPTSTTFPNGAGTLNVRLRGDWPVLEVLGETRSHTITGQIAESWQYFTLIVPENDAIKGVYVSLANVTSGSPRMVIRKGTTLPSDFSTSRNLSSDSTAWQDGEQWFQSSDFTGIVNNSTGKTHSGQGFLAAYGAPMGPGTYTIGVTKDSSINTVSKPDTPNMDYTIRVDAIGEDLDYDVTELVPNNSASPEPITALAERDHRFFKVTIPPGYSSWRIKLEESYTTDTPPEVCDGMLTIRRDHIPAFDTGSSPSSKGGATARLIGQGDHWALLPSAETSTIEAGDYYIAATSLGRKPTAIQTGIGPCDLTLHTRGEITVDPIAPLVVDVPTTRPYDLEPAELAAFEFTVPERPEGVTPYGFTIRINRDLGRSNFSLRLTNPSDTGLPVPPGNGKDGFSGGRSSQFASTDTIVGQINYQAIPGTYKVTVRSTGTPYDRAAGSISVMLFDPGAEIPTLDFDGGSITVTNGGALTDILPFRVIVPDEPKWKAWGVRLTGPHEGKPSLIVRRDQPVEASAGPLVDSDHTSWPTLSQWTQPNDYTKLINDPAYGNTTDKDRSQQFFVAARDRPLQPGTYFVGIDNRGTSIISARSFTIETFAFGEGYSVPVSDLTEIGSTAEIEIDEPRMPSVHKITVPPSTKSWALSLLTFQGDFTLRVRHAHIPDTNNSTYPDLKGGVHIQKGGDERFTLLPKNGEQFLIPGDYYIAAVSEGQAPSLATKTIGTGSASAVLTNLGPVGITDLGTIGENGIARTVLLDPAEVKFYTVEIPAGINNLQFRLNDRAGDASIVVVPGTNLPAPNLTESYGIFGGTTGTTLKKDKAIVNLSNPAPGTYTIALRAGGVGPSSYSAASATLSIDILRPASLNFSQTLNEANGLSHTDARTLADKQKFFYRIPVPEQLGGEEILGWLVTLDQGSPIVKFYKSEADFGKTALVTMNGRTALIVPPLLSPGSTWFIEVEGVGTTDYVIRSEPVSLSAAPWTLPTEFNQHAGDTNPGQPDGVGIGIELAQDFWNFYAVDVPEENLGLIRFFLEASNGNPNVYIRPGGIPTTDHRSTGTGGDYLYQHKMIGLESEAANFSAISNKTNQPDKLEPGRWFIGVKSDPVGLVRTSSRYRLKTHSGVVTDIDLNTPVPLTAQNLSEKDWRYYRVTIPRDGVPAGWLPAFTRISGSAQLYIRDTIPPFSYTPPTSTSTTFNHWATDEKNRVTIGSYQSAINPGPISFAVPPLRPGHTYYLGFYGATGGSFDVSSSTTSATASLFDFEMEYDTGEKTLTLQPGEQRIFRFNVPEDATRIKIDTVHSATGIRLKLEQGAPPDTSPNVTAHFQNPNTLPATYAVNRPLDGTWPFVPDQDYYLLLSNTTDAPIDSTITMKGVNALTEDEDNDGVPDTWERLHFTNLAQTAISDFDKDGSTTLEEYLNGTDPKDVDSAFYRITLTAPGGSFSISPQMDLYPKNANVTITATPVAEDGFLRWTSAIASINNSTAASITFPVTTSVTATAVFSTPLGKALETPDSRAWITSGTASWFGQYLFSSDGQDAAASPPLGTNSTADLTSTFIGPGTLTFRWRVSSRPTSHPLSVIAEGITVPDPISGNTMVDWAPVTMEIPAGEHTITWRFTKNNHSPLGEDSAWVDAVTFTGTTPAEPGFDEWQQNNFDPTERMDEDVSSPNADPDHDGIPNLLEAALATLPKSHDKASDLLRVSHTGMNGTNREIHILSRTATEGMPRIRLCLQANTGISDTGWITISEKTGNTPWSNHPSTTADQPTTTGPQAPVTFTETIPATGSATRFYRLYAEIVP